MAKFRDLKLGQHFRFPAGGSFDRIAKKVTSRCYVWADARAHHKVVGRGRSAHFVGRPRAGVVSGCVGTINVRVEPTSRASPVKRRKGRGRGRAVLSGLRRRR